MSSSTQTLLIKLPQDKPRSYDIIIKQGVLDHAGTLLKEKLGTRRCLIVTDQNVAPLYLKRTETALSGANHQVLKSITLPAGEATKSWDHLKDLLEKIAERGGDRKTLLVVLGGGVIGDLTGFAASIYMRGIDFIQIPTTLLAQVDSAVGGKTGIDTIFGKNTVGAFHQPKLVLTDPQTLSTLPNRQILAGYAEIVKYGLVMDAPFFEWCDTNGEALIKGNIDKQIEAIHKSCTLKAQLVLEDERESGRRALLNLGHTFGHALESWTGFNDTLLHGEAVAIGTIMAFDLSVEMGLCPAADALRVKAHFKAIGLPTKPLKMNYNIDKLLTLMTQDKKAENGQLTLILLHGIGQGFLAPNINAPTIHTFLQKSTQTN